MMAFCMTMKESKKPLILDEAQSMNYKNILTITDSIVGIMT